MRLLRRGLIKGYIKVPERAEYGRQHLHILFRGSCIEHQLIKAMWQQIHQSEIVDIRLVSPRRHPKALASYMAKYMSKELAGRYSWSWGWVWRGFCRDWTTYKRWWWQFVHVEDKNSFTNCIIGWDLCLAGVITLDFRNMELMLSPPP